METGSDETNPELLEQKEEDLHLTKYKRGREDNRPDWQRYDRRPRNARQSGRGRRRGRRRS